jgi:hypothetical protein
MLSIRPATSEKYTDCNRLKMHKNIDTVIHHRHRSAINLSTVHENAISLPSDIRETAAQSTRMLRRSRAKSRQQIQYYDLNAPRAVLPGRRVILVEIIRYKSYKT